MCGLFGMIGPDIKLADLGLVQTLAYLSGLRGLDGTGVCQGAVTRRRVEHRVTKSSMNSVNFLDYHVYCRNKGSDSSILNSVGDNFMLGHTRYATKGFISDENAHPFEFPSLVGMHNGTLLDTAFQSTTKTDSELMFETMDKEGVAVVLRDLNPKSAWAIAILNKDSGDITIGRNDKRPLFFASNKDRKVFYYASEIRFLMFAAGRHNVELSTVYEATPDHLYTFSPRTDIEKNKTPDWDKRSIHIKKPIVYLAPDPKDTPRLPASGGSVQTEKTPRILPVVANTKGPQFNTFCVTCGMEMDLYEQHRGQEVSPNLYACEECITKEAETIKLAETRLH